MLPALSERHDLPQHPGPLMPSGKKGRWVNGSTCSSISISTLLSHARVWETGAALFALLALLACVSRGRLGAPAYARQFGQVEGRTEVYPVVSLFKELEKVVRPSPG